MGRPEVAGGTATIAPTDTANGRYAYISSLSTAEQESDSDGSGRRPRCDKVLAVPPKHLSRKDPPPSACRLFQCKARAVTAEHDDTTDKESRYGGRGPR